MKLQYMPPAIQETILVSAVKVLGECADMHHMLGQVDVLLKHDFPEIVLNTFADDIEDLEDRLARAKWIKSFSEEFEKFFIEIKYPQKYWRNTISAELSSWVAGDAWKEYSPADAAKTNFSYWEK